MKLIELVPLKVPVTKSILIPGSKSFTNRALVMAALTHGEVTLVNPLESDDTDAMIDCLKTIGISILKKNNVWTIVNDVSVVKNVNYELNAHLSGTTIRFILALSCIVPGVKHIFGDEGLNKRPIRDLVTSLKAAGAEIFYEQRDGFPPLKVTSSFLPSGNIVVRGGTSSQFISALLMIAPEIGEVIIDVDGNQISKSYIDITISMMKEWGVLVKNNNYQKYNIAAGQPYKIDTYNVEGDYSAAGYFFAIAAVTKSTITIKNLNPNSVQGDKQFPQILKGMGNEIVYGDNEITITGRGVKPVEIDMEQCPDQVQTLAVLSSFAHGKTVLTGVRSLRVKETERVRALQNELAKMGIKTESPNEDTLIIYGGNPHSAEINTYGDHRMAMSFAVAGSVLNGMRIYNPEVVNKTFPRFWDTMKEIGVTYF